MLDLDHVIDLCVYVASEEGCRVQVGAADAVAYVGESACVPIAGSGLESWVDGVCAQINAEMPRDGDFQIAIDGTRWRGARRKSNGTTQVWLRRLPVAAATLEDLSMPMGVRALLTQPWLNDGGLVLFAGLTGQGKTTAATATVTSRLLAYGGRAVGVEDVTEVPMEGRWGGGTCRQLTVDYDTDVPHDAGFSGAVRYAYRCMPAARPAILYVGEVRDTETAVEVVKSASNGMLVISTIHAGDPQAALLRLSALAAAGMGDASAMVALAQAVRLVVSQTVRLRRDVKGWSRGVYDMTIAASGGAASPLANNIRKGTFAQMQQIIDLQNTRLRRAAPGASLLQQLLGDAA